MAKLDKVTKLGMLLILLLIVAIGCEKSYITRPPVEPAPADTTEHGDDDEDDN